MLSNDDLKNLQLKIEEEIKTVQLIKDEVNKIIVGQQYLTERLLACLLSNGHVLLEGVPGLAKTLIVKTLAKVFNGKFSRIQFTPDLLPADITGTLIYNQNLNEFSIRKGPVFANFVLADEVNRAPAKVQSALLEVMQEKQVTIGEETFVLDEPFLVLATQNPLDQDGTYPLPEAQLDRFMMKLLVDYPSMEEEILIVRRHIQNLAFPEVKKHFNIEWLLKIRELIKYIYVDKRIEQYIVDIVFATRYPEKYGLEKIKPYLQYGASPRASINLALASKAVAFLNNRSYVTADDIKEIAPDVLRHRIGLNYESELENIKADDLINTVLNNLKVP